MEVGRQAGRRGSGEVSNKDFRTGGEDGRLRVLFTL